MRDNFILGAHRGLSASAPENTIAAFELAISKSFPHIEFDAQLSADGAAVVIHDSEVDRTTDGAGPVASLSLAELQALDAGSWFASEFAGERISALAEVLERLVGRAHIYLELKSSEPELPGHVAEDLRDSGWLLETGDAPDSPVGLSIVSFSLPQLQRSLVELGKGVRHGWLVHEITREIITQAENAELTGLCVKADNVDSTQVGLARDAGLHVRGWGVGDLTDLQRLIDAGASGTTVNWPDRARRYMDSP